MVTKKLFKPNKISFVKNIIFMSLIFFIMFSHLNYAGIIFFIYITCLTLANIFWGFNVVYAIYRKFSTEFYSFKSAYSREFKQANLFDDEESITTEEKKILDYFIILAKTNLGFAPLPKSTIFDGILERYRLGVSHKDIKSICGEVCRYLKADPKFLEIQIYSLNKYLNNHLGYFSAKNRIGGLIGISVSPYYDIEILLSIIIHECMHYYMHLNKYEIAPDLNEYFTDYLIIHMGLSKYMLLGYKRINIISENFIPGFHQFALGYLNESQILYVEKRLYQKSLNNRFDL
ncbi:MAG: hypothetical protein GX675_04660 [Erysipelotrichaceae bacterium]|nr:hypothetical protein [Erysipelotrichaceae bacterium]